MRPREMTYDHPTLTRAERPYDPADLSSHEF